MSTPNQPTTDITRSDSISEPGREGHIERPVDAAAYDDTAHEGTADTPAVRDPAVSDPAVSDEADSDRPAVPTGRADPSGTDAEGRERLVPRDRADDYGSRWDAVKGTFVDEPRRAVRAADELVGELLEELEELFRKQRQSLEHGLDADETSTEDLRLALRRYRSFFDRLLSL